MRTAAPCERHDAFVRSNYGESVKNAGVCCARGSTPGSWACFPRCRGAGGGGRVAVAVSQGDMGRAKVQDRTGMLRV